ncbi:MAG: hypothetical protein GC158_11720 [Cyanobacteria bacterium RI_101]|nr:hypothetical protein [Cyanobacteria bacterium RI_101]
MCLYNNLQKNKVGNTDLAMKEPSIPNPDIYILGGLGAGAVAAQTVGGVGLVGSFGGLGLGAPVLIGLGGLGGAACYGAVQGWRTEDGMALGAVTLGALGGAGWSAAFGGVGVGIGGAAFGAGLGTLSAAGGIFGLGIYGAARLLGQPSAGRKAAENLCFLENLTQERTLEHSFRSLEIDKELRRLQAQLGREPQPAAAPSTMSAGAKHAETDASDWEISAEPLLHVKPVTALAFSSDSRYLFSASHSGQVKIWDLLLSNEFIPSTMVRKKLTLSCFFPNGICSYLAAPVARFRGTF